MRNSNSPPSYQQGAQPPPPGGPPPGGPPPGGPPPGGPPPGGPPPGGPAAWHQQRAMQAMPEKKRGLFQGVAQRFGRQPDAGMQPPPPGGPPPGMQPPPQQQGMAGLGQAARGMYDRARVNALRGRGQVQQ